MLVAGLMKLPMVVRAVVSSRPATMSARTQAGAATKDGIS